MALIHGLDLSRGVANRGRYNLPDKYFTILNFGAPAIEGSLMRGSSCRH